MCVAVCGGERKQFHLFQLGSLDLGKHGLGGVGDIRGRRAECQEDTEERREEVSESSFIDDEDEDLLNALGFMVELVLRRK